MSNPKTNPPTVSLAPEHFYSAGFGPQEISDLEALPENSGLMAEIEMMCVIIRRLFDTATAQAATLEDWRQAVAALGAACGRLSTLLKAERQISLRGADTAAVLRQALSEVFEELGL